jgi:peptidoglycan/xylan/chitin deacetylase (PgdA/CDA1 family)
VTPPPDPLDAGAGSSDEEDRRRRFLRRRVTAGAAALLVVIWLISLFSGSGSGRHVTSTATQVTVGSAATVREARRQAALAAEQKREEQAIENVLSYTAFVTSGSADKRELALTFDDGPGPFTAQVVATLDRLHVPATFFVVGRAVKDFGASLPAEVAGGFVIGDHTQDHAPMTTLSRADQVNQLLDQSRAIRPYGAPFPHLFRPPYGQFNATTLAITRKLKMLTILWTIDTNDFSQPGVEKIVSSVIDGAKPGAIVLMHDAGGPRTQTVAAIPRIVAGLRHRGYTLVTVPRLIADDPPNSSQEVPPTGLSGG